MVGITEQCCCSLFYLLPYPSYAVEQKSSVVCTSMHFFLLISYFQLPLLSILFLGWGLSICIFHESVVEVGTSSSFKYSDERSQLILDNGIVSLSDTEFQLEFIIIKQNIRASGDYHLDSTCCYHTWVLKTFLSWVHVFISEWRTICILRHIL